MGAAPSKTPAEILKENKNAIRASIREIDRETRQIEKRKKEVEAKIKKAAEERQMGQLKIFAKDVVRCKKAIEKFEIAKANLQGIQIQLQTASGNEAIMSAMKGATTAYKSLNSLLDPKAMQRIMAEYEKESTRQEMMSEIMDDTMSNAMGDDEQAEDELVDQVLQELGVAAATGMGSAPMGQAAVANNADALQNRLNTL